MLEETDLIVLLFEIIVDVDALVGESWCDFNEDVPSLNDGVPAKAIADATTNVAATPALTSLCQLLPGLLLTQ